MGRQFQSLAIAAIVAFWQSTAFTAQTWTYQFTPTSSQPYNASCGECVLLVSTNADVAGTFTLLLDWDTHTGKILELNDHLENVVDVVRTDTGYESVPSNLPTKDYGIIPPWNGKPIYVPTTISFANGLGHMKSDGRIPLPGGGYRSGQVYEVWFTPTAATLNMVTGSDDYYITVTAATAAFQSSAWSGDLNHDGRVDKRDYLLLRKSTGAAADYDAWRWSLGNVYFGAGSSTVPEPAIITLMLFASASLLPIRRRPCARR